MSEAVEELWPARATIRQVRSTYIDNPHLGLATWFDEFDRLLLQQDFPKCFALLKEIREEEYELDGDERVYVDSREAAALLNQGISYQRQQDYEKARQYYEASRRIYRLLNEVDGEGKANLALNALQNQQASKQIDSQLLRSLAANPKVIGNSSTLLTERVRHLEADDQRQVILAAKKRGYPMPLLAGLSSRETATQSAAATALAWLQPGPDYGTLLDAMLTSTNWIVRWQAVSILRWRVEN